MRVCTRTLTPHSLAAQEVLVLLLQLTFGIIDISCGNSPIHQREVNTDTRLCSLDELCLLFDSEMHVKRELETMQNEN